LGMARDADGESGFDLDRFPEVARRGVIVYLPSRMDGCPDRRRWIKSADRW